MDELGVEFLAGGVENLGEFVVVHFLRGVFKNRRVRIVEVTDYCLGQTQKCLNINFPTIPDLRRCRIVDRVFLFLKILPELRPELRILKFLQPTLVLFPNHRYGQSDTFSCLKIPGYILSDRIPTRAQTLPDLLLQNMGQVPRRRQVAQVISEIPKCPIQLREATLQANPMVLIFFDLMICHLQYPAKLAYVRFFDHT